jgi:hypothetical protein
MSGLRCKPAWGKRARAAALLLGAAALLAGCAASTVADHMPTAVGGLPEDAPKRPDTQAAYPAVHDRPGARSEAVLTAAEQKRLEDELIAARDRGAGASAGSTRKP